MNLKSKRVRPFVRSRCEKPDIFSRVNGTYEALIGGSATEAMEDFSGGLCEMFDLNKGAPENLFSIMQKSHERQSMMGCSVQVRVHPTAQWSNVVQTNYSLCLSNHFRRPVAEWSNGSRTYTWPSGFMYCTINAYFVLPLQVYCLFHTCRSCIHDRVV